MRKGCGKVGVGVFAVSAIAPRCWASDTLGTLRTFLGQVEG